MRFQMNKGLLAIILLLLLVTVLNLFNIRLNITDFALFYINGQPVTLFNIVVLALLLWVVRQLASPFRELVLVLLVLWILSMFAGAFLSGISSLVLMVIFLLIVFQFLGWFI